MASEDNRRYSKEEAIALGHKVYWGGSICKKGHDAPRRINGNACTECQRINLQIWRDENRDYVIERDRKYAETRVDRRRSLERDRYALNPEKFIEKTRKYYWKNQELCREKAKEYHQKNYLDENVRLKAQKRVDQWRIDNPERYKINTKVQKDKRRRTEKQVEGSFTAEDIEEIYKLQKGKCAYCKMSIESGYEVDHIVPISKGGTSYRNNLQLLCPKKTGNGCNQKKGAKDPIDFARTLGLLL
jgi:5-methylcytosine-specific restriction endonuclease McrA